MAFTNFKALSIALFTSAGLFAENTCTPKCKQEKPTLAAGYNAPSRIAIDRCWDVFVTSSFTYWSPSQENMELGISGSSDSLYTFNGKVIDLNPGFAPGFKVGLGTNIDRDSWDFYLEYTWFRSHFEKDKSLNSSSGLSLYPEQTIPSASNSSSYLSGEESWRLHMDLLDFDIARHYYVGKQLMFHPFIGARGVKITQKLQANYFDEVTGALIFNNLSFKQISHSWGLGPRTGLSLDWILGKGFQMIGKSAFDILFTQYTKLNTKQIATDTTGAVQKGNSYFFQEDTVNTLKGHYEMELGFSWGTYWGQNQWYADIAATYNFQVFFNQNMFRHFLDDSSLATTLAPNGNLYMQGLNIMARFDF